jgi:hypothetical protein
MKWFKHESNARNGEKLSALECRAGLEGYGFYFKTVEIIAGLMDATSKCHASFSPSSWARQTNITTKKWLFLAQCCADAGLIELQCDADVATVNIPKLLKRRDNHTKNLQVTNQDADKKVSLEKEREKEKDIEVEREEEETHSPDGDSGKKSLSKATRLPTDWQPDEVLLAWAKTERPDLNLKLTVDTFRDYWTAKAGKDATKTNWPGTFRNWVRREKAQAIPQKSADYRRPAL